MQPKMPETKAVQQRRAGRRGGWCGVWCSAVGRPAFAEPLQGNPRQAAFKAKAGYSLYNTPVLGESCSMLGVRFKGRVQRLAGLSSLALASGESGQWQAAGRRPGKARGGAQSRQVSKSAPKHRENHLNCPGAGSAQCLVSSRCVHIDGQFPRCVIHEQRQTAATGIEHEQLPRVLVLKHLQVALHAGLAVLAHAHPP